MHRSRNATLALRGGLGLAILAGLWWGPRTPAAQTSGLQPVDPSILGSCPAEVHDRFVVTGPDGGLYRTWHSQEVPRIAGKPASGSCRFAHEHGDDPKRSRANRQLPAFGWINAAAGAPHDEPHEGFKVFVANKGTVNDEGRKARTSSRIVAHMGTGGPARFTRPHHSLEFDLKAGPYRIRAQGMADTALAGSICERDAGQGIGRTVVLVPGAGCGVGSLYEIWQFVLSLRWPDGTEVARIHASTAAFDPITVMDPADRSRRILTRDAWPRWGEPSGCDREAYHGPVYWYNRGGATNYRTDAFGVIRSDGPLRQTVSRHDAIGIPMSPDQSQFKLHRPTCGPGLGTRN